MCRSLHCIGPIVPRVVAIDSDYWEIVVNPIRFNHFEYKKIKINKFFIRFTTLFSYKLKNQVFMEKIDSIYKPLKKGKSNDRYFKTRFSLKTIVSQFKKKINSFKELIVFGENNCLKRTTKIHEL